MSLCINHNCRLPNNPHDNFFCQSCGSELLIDGRYRVIKELGQGGFGTTYEVLNANSESRVLKVLMDNQPKYVELFKQEAEVLARLNHPCIPFIDPDGYFQYYSSQSPEPLHCIVMEKVEGLDLNQYISQRGNRPIQPKRALRWLAELSLIIEEVHDQGFFHRDIKPANIMLRLNGSLALIDFGTVRQLTGTYLNKQGSGKVTGVISSGYTPVEQIRGQAVQQSDFYALGATMIFLLTGQDISQFLNPQTNKIEWYQANLNIHPRFLDLIDYTIEDLPTNRPQTAREIFNIAISIDPSLERIQEYFAGTSYSQIGYRQDSYIPRNKTSLVNHNSRVISDRNSRNSQADYISLPSRDSHVNSQAGYFSPEDETVFMRQKSRIANRDYSRLVKNSHSYSNSSHSSISSIQPQNSQLNSNIENSRSFSTKSEISQEFIDRCCQELAEFMGPIAKKICQSTLKNNPQIAKRNEFVTKISQVIPNAEEINQFRQRVL